VKSNLGNLALCTFGILLFALWANVDAYAQNRTAAAVNVTPSSSSSSPSKPSSSQQHISKVKITSPIKGQQLPVGKDLTVSGTSIDNATARCEVSVIVNNVKPYQPAISTTGATRTGAIADYSKWKFDITSKYTTIKPGANRITAKYECEDNPASKSFSSVNVTGVR
jgi:hypothetical protein